MRRILPTLLLLSMLALPLLATAQETQEPPANEVPLVVPPGAQAGPDFDIDRATQAYIETLSAEKRARSDAYFEGGYWLQLWSFVYGLGTAWVFLGLRISARMRDFAERRTGNATLQSVIYALLYIPLSTLLALPLGWYAGFFREHQYGMATQTLPAWLGDQGMGLAVSMILGTLFIAVIYAVFRKTGRNWWVYGTLTAVAFMVFAVLISPLYIDPLFNDYKSLPPSPIRDRILSIAHATGVPADDVVWFDASRQTKRISANVAGLGETMRVALNDNLLARSPPESIEAVMGHELGHYTLNHIYEGLIYYGLIFLVGFGFVAWSYQRVVARWGAAWGLRGPVADMAGLPLVGALFSAYLFIASPVLNSVVRSNEAEADRYGLATSNQPDGFAFVAMQLSEYRKIQPGKWEEILFYDHPSGYARVRAAMEWKAEHGGREASTAVP